MNKKIFKLALIYPKAAFFGTDMELLKFWEKTKEKTGRLWSNFEVWSGFNTGLLVIAALTPKDFTIKLIDENFEQIDFKEKYDLVAISFMTQQANRAYEIADNFINKGSRVVLGGIHATVLPEEAKKHCNSVVIGEAEDVWPKLIEDFRENKLSPYYKSSLVDMTKSPMPRYDLLKPEYYKSAWIQTSRGCPRDCEFCAATNVFGNKYRHKNVEQVENEIKAVKSLKNNIMIGFADDNMLVDRKYAKDIIERIKKLNIRWFVQTDISIAKDDDLLRSLADSGCMMVFIGFESVNKKSLQKIDKTLWKYKRYDEYKKSIEKIQSYGMGILGAFILGLDEDFNSIFKETSKFIIENHLYSAQITVLTPLPGTQLRKRLEKESRIFSNNWEDYSLTTVTYNPRNMTANELQRGLLDVYKTVYSNEANMDRLRYYKEIFRSKMKGQ
ncbi:MAG: radical SAM protein [Candidatus Omnitrophota bacterium]